MRIDTEFAQDDFRVAGTTVRVPRSRAIVVFEDRGERSAIRLLQPGFRHCFCVVGSGHNWTICDPLKTRIELVQLSGFDEHQLAQHYTRAGRTVLAGSVLAGRRTCGMRLRPLTCVEVVKRILNIDAWLVFTPAQLYRALISTGSTLRFTLYPPPHHGRADMLDDAIL